TIRVVRRGRTAAHHPEQLRSWADDTSFISNSTNTCHMELRDDLTQLNNVKDLLVDSQKGYLQAAERVEDVQLKGILTHLSNSRTSLLAGMDKLIAAAAPDQAPREGGTIKGDLHRTWMEVRDALSASDNA